MPDYSQSGSHKILDTPINAWVTTRLGTYPSVNLLPILHTVSQPRYDLKQATCLCIEYVTDIQHILDVTEATV